MQTFMCMLLQGFKGGSHWADVELTMEATQPDSLSCLQASTCWPLGGFNVWAAMPPLPANTSSGLPQRSGKPVTLVVAQVDSNALFHDSTQVGCG
jgi:nicastrin